MWLDDFLPVQHCGGEDITEEQVSFKYTEPLVDCFDVSIGPSFFEKFMAKFIGSYEGLKQASTESVLAVCFKRVEVLDVPKRVHSKRVTSGFRKFFEACKSSWDTRSHIVLAETTKHTLHVVNRIETECFCLETKELKGHTISRGELQEKLSKVYLIQRQRQNE